MNSPAIDREGFIATLSKELEHTQAQHLITVVAVLDISQFHQINHIHGHHAGDEVLKEIYKRICSIPKQSGYCFRIDGDRFALILSPVISAQLATLMGKKISGMVAPPFKIGERQVSVKFGVGFTSSENSATSAEIMLVRAEQAAKIAKTREDRFHHLNDDGDNAVQLRLDIEEEVARAMKENELQLFYQPKVCMETGLPASAEALLRWDSQLGSISPQELVDIIEDSGRMVELFTWTLNTALRQSCEWPELHGRQQLALNMSASCLDLSDLCDIVDSALKLWDVDPRQLCLEVTESAIQKDVDQGFSLLENLKKIGVSISIDDFGTGYSSIEYFKHIPAQELKIDKSFVQNMHDNEVDKEIVKLILDWGKRFEMKTVAEGIEDRNSLEELKDLGCNYGQGYHFSRALQQEEYVVWLNNYQKSQYFG